MLREESLKRGCAFWDMHSAMGGVGSAGRWFEAKIMSEDLVHPRGKGAEILGHLFVAALERARLTRAARANDLRQDPPGIGAPERLERFFGKLDALTRLTLQDEIASLWASQGFTAVLVTHDVEEALRLSNRVVVLSERPAHVVEDIRVPAGLGSDEAAPEFQRLRRHVLSLLGR